MLRKNARTGLLEVLAAEDRVQFCRGTEKRKRKRNGDNKGETGGKENREDGRREEDRGF